MIKLTKRYALLFSLLFSQAAVAEQQNEWGYAMQPGESVWSVAHELLTDWREWKTIERLNNVRNDRQMSPGTVLKIPRNLIQEKQSDIKILDVNGDVTAQVKLREGKAKALLPLSRGQSLSQGDLIKTAAQASVLLEFDDGTQVLLLGDSVLRIEQATVIGNKRKVVDIKVFLEEGEAEIRANPAKVPGSRFLIDTPVAFATTKGTTYRVRAQGESTAAEVTQGLIGVGNKLGATNVRQGYGTLTKANEPPKKPKKLLPAPVLPEIDNVVRYLPGKLAWDKLDGASQYRSQISPDQAFTAIVYDQISAHPKMGLPAALEDRSYWIRVSAISAEGLQGLSSLQQINIEARPFPPVRQGPMPSDSLYVGEIEFSWSKPELADSFVFEIAKDKSFTEIIETHDNIKETQFVAVVSEPGNFFWRVSSVTQEGKHGPEGHAGAFKVKPVPPKPEMREPVSSETEISFSWQEEEGVSFYQLQLAKDKAFKQLVVDNKTEQASLAIDKPQAGTYYMRVRSIDADDYAGEWTEPQEVVQPVENWWPMIISGSLSVLLLL
ncbi:FecR domain-containing protein [Neptuniibacter sp. PT34_22]|uniref:FecR domain-containing protein n=1 Tax=Neptuniibacter sp. PT34_22 TaxID=3398205 RepID=UPI0039F58E16